MERGPARDVAAADAVPLRQRSGRAAGGGAVAAGRGAGRVRPVLLRWASRAEPTALVAPCEWEHYVDIVVIRGVDRVTAARLPKGAGVDVFAPEVVVWAYQGCAEWALRALLDLVHRRHPDAPTVAHPVPRSLHVPRCEQRPLTVRLPSPGRAGVRATRLAATMTATAHDLAGATRSCPGSGRSR